LSVLDACASRPISDEKRENTVSECLHPDVTRIRPSAHCQPQVLAAQFRQIRPVPGLQMIRRRQSAADAVLGQRRGPLDSVSASDGSRTVRRSSMPRRLSLIPTAPSDQEAEISLGRNEIALIARQRRSRLDHRDRQISSTARAIARRTLRSMLWRIPQAAYKPVSQARRPARPGFPVRRRGGGCPTRWNVTSPGM